MDLQGRRDRAFRLYITFLAVIGAVLLVAGLIGFIAGQPPLLSAYRALLGVAYLLLAGYCTQMRRAGTVGNPRKQRALHIAFVVGFLLTGATFIVLFSPASPRA